MKRSRRRSGLYLGVPMLLIGKGIAEIQKTIIGCRLLDRFKLATG